MNWPLFILEDCGYYVFRTRLYPYNMAYKTLLVNFLRPDFWPVLQMAVLFCWENRRHEKLTLENLRLATELPENELRRTLWGLVAFPKLKRQLLVYEPQVSKPTEFNSSTMFSINHSFGILKNGKLQKRGKLNLIGRLQVCSIPDSIVTYSKPLQ